MVIAFYMNKKLIVLFLALIVFVGVKAQDTMMYGRIVRELSSAKYQGRGYAMDGVVKAGKYLENEFLKAGADEVVTQSFPIDINTFPGKMEMAVDDRKLSPGKDFVMREYSPGIHGSFGLYFVDTVNYDPDKFIRESEGLFAVCDFWFTYKHKEDFRRLEKSAAGVIYVWNTPLKFYKAYGEKVVEKPIVWVSQDFPKDASKVCFDIDNRFITGYVSDNVIARIDGRRHDSCYVFTAHYDHLGNLGSDVFFPGANDNASGTASIVTLASYYSQNQPEFDIWCIAFSGEDANLRGSTWFVEHPLFPLETVKYLFNFDMVADNNPRQYCEVSEEGMAGFKKMEHIAGYLERGDLAANSDHWPFADRGVPCILFENESGDYFKYYHTAEDTWENTETVTYEKLFKLVTQFLAGN